MIFTVFVAGNGPANEWRAQLLEYSWRRLRQPGELVRLTPARSGETLPTHLTARVVRALPWNPHPYTGDPYPGYETPAALMEWLFREKIDGTVVLLGSQNVFQHPIRQEASRRKVRAMSWPDLPRGEGPFGLSEEFRFLECYCVNRELALPPVRPPFIVHSSDLRRIAARWLELTAIIRAEYDPSRGKP